jgi:hypothetical protein
MQLIDWSTSTSTVGSKNAPARPRACRRRVRVLSPAPRHVPLDDGELRLAGKRADVGNEAPAGGAWRGPRTRPATSWTNSS